MGVVDQSVPYYRSDGYWNGTVWMPHQFFMWKALLGLGKPSLTFNIANTALNLYERETTETYYTTSIFLLNRAVVWTGTSSRVCPILCCPGFRLTLNPVG